MFLKKQSAIIKIIAELNGPHPAAINQAYSYGLRIDDLDTSGKLVRVSVDGDKGQKKSGWYVAHEFKLKNGETIVVGRYGNWKLSDDKKTFKADYKLSEEDRKALKEKQGADRKRVEAERKRANSEAVKRSAEMALVLPDTGNTEYLKRKQVRGYAVYYGKGDTLFVPVFQHERGLVGLVGFQVISPDGDKKFLTGTEKRNGYHLVGADVESETLLIAEGYATAASLYEATGFPCYVAFDAGNLLLVAKLIHKLYPDKRIVICADDDHATENNPGITKATAAASAVNGRMVVPEFVDKTGKTDFNDMHVEQGLGAVKNHVLSQINRMNGYRDDREVDSGENANPVTAVINPARDFSLGAVLKYFFVIYGQGTLIYDSKREIFMSASDFRIAVGNDIYKQFFSVDERKMVLKDNVVFSPGVDNLPAGYINLFKGLPLKPKKGKCNLLLDILFHLCGEEKQTYEWTLKWLAYPLQNLGAKMATAIVIHGREGTGKNLFLSSIQRIYGNYTSIITQNDIESNFNGWASRKLFVIANEVVSRQEMFHKKGIIKNMITEPEWNINEKNINSRKEANHANFVFCSNFLQPVAPDKDDRRYLVLWSPAKQDKAFYKAAAHERDNGGVEALYHYLLNYDLGEFDEYTEPVMTDAKLDLIMLSMKSDERFIELWLDEDLPLPLLPVLTSDLYQEYKHWCNRDGEKFHVSQTEFSAVLGKHELINKKNHQRYSDGLREKKGTFAIPYGFEPEEGVSASKWLTESNSKFNNAVSELKRES